MLKRKKKKELKETSITRLDLKGHAWRQKARSRVLASTYNISLLVTNQSLHVANTLYGQRRDLAASLGATGCSDLCLPLDTLNSNLISNGRKSVPYVHYICTRRAEFSVPRLRDMEILVQKDIFRIFHEILKFREILYKNMFFGKFGSENGFCEKFGNFAKFCTKIYFPENLWRKMVSVRNLEILARNWFSHVIWKISAGSGLSGNARSGLSGNARSGFAKIPVGSCAPLFWATNLYWSHWGTNRVTDVLKKNRRRASYTLNITH